jgi:hypothetical protein
MAASVSIIGTPLKSSRDRRIRPMAKFAAAWFWFSERISWYKDTARIRAMERLGQGEGSGSPDWPVAESILLYLLRT